MSLFLRDKWSLTALVILCWALIASLTTGYYYYQYNNLNSRLQGAFITVNLGLDYGNNTRVWFNKTQALSGMSLFDITTHLTNATYSADTVFGASIESINGVENSYPFWWMWWRWNSTGWLFGEVGIDNYIVSNGETILWYYEVISLWPPPKPN
jgi:hypothetical protein